MEDNVPEESNTNVPLETYIEESNNIIPTQSDAASNNHPIDNIEDQHNENDIKPLMPPQEFNMIGQSDHYVPENPHIPLPDKFASDTNTRREKPLSVYQKILMEKANKKKKGSQKKVASKVVEVQATPTFDSPTLESIDMLYNLKNTLYGLQTQAASYRLQNQKVLKENQTLKLQFEKMREEICKSEASRQQDSLYINKQEKEISTQKLKLGAYNDSLSDVKVLQAMIKKEEAIKEKFENVLTQLGNYCNQSLFENVDTQIKVLEEEKSDKDVIDSSIIMKELEILDQCNAIHSNITKEIKSVIKNPYAEDANKKGKLIEMYNIMKNERLLEQKKIAELEKQLAFLKEEQKFNSEELHKANDPMVNS